LTGCALTQPHLDQAVQNDQGAADRNQGVAESYVVCFPDLLELKIASWPELSGLKAVDPDGRIDLGLVGRLRIEGRTVPETARCVAEALRIPPTAVSIRVADYRSQYIYLFGQGIGLQRAVAYKGPETVLDLLHRTGAIVPGAAPNEVYVVRHGAAPESWPQVLHIDLEAILRNKDQHTNVRLQAFDQVHIGETRQSRIAKCIPPCLRPAYEAVWGLRGKSDRVTR
jgi:polysaccharide export outer membrane protein